MKQVISVIHALTANAGGVTRVALSRCDAFVAKGMVSFVAITDYDQNLLNTFTLMRNQGRISPRVEVVNFYSYYSHLAERFLEAGRSETLANINLTASLAEVVTKRVDLIESFNIRVVRYYTKSGYLVVQELIDEQNDCVWLSISLPGHEPLQFTSKDDAYSYWLKNLSESCLPAAIIADSPRSCDLVLNVSGKDIYRILMIHNNHFRPPFKPGVGLNDRYGKVLSGLPRADALVVLTKMQRKHICDQFTDRGNIFVIGNPLTKFNTAEPIHRDPHLAVAVCRLHPMKNLVKIIENFGEVVRRIPAAKLEIWGSGVEEQLLRETIINLNLEKSIFLKGYTTDAASVFRRASVSVAASLFEGFGVSFAESLSVGTPLVSFKTYYGPEEIITDEQDGYLVDDDEQFINRVCQLLTSPELVESMGAYGPANMEKFSHNEISNKWMDAFKIMEEAGGRSLTDQDASFGDLAHEKMNVSGSAFGWIYFSSGLDADIPKVIRELRAVRLIKVVQQRGFKGERTLLVEGDYTVESMEFVEDRNLFRFRVGKNETVYKGAIGNSSLTFQFDFG